MLITTDDVISCESTMEWRKITSAIITAYIMGVLCIMICSCIIPTDAPDETFQFQHNAQIDTIAPWGVFDIVFSNQLADSTELGFSFNPTFYSFSVEYSNTRDTVQVHLSEPLLGKTRYVIRLLKEIHSKTGAKFEPPADSVVIYTTAMEQESNDGVLVADTLVKSCHGSIATVNDTDWYLIDDSSVKKIFLNAEGSQTTFYLDDNRGLQTDERTFQKSDTLQLPDDFSSPYYVVVHSYSRSVGGFYQVGYHSK